MLQLFLHPVKILYISTKISDIYETHTLKIPNINIIFKYDVF